MSRTSWSEFPKLKKKKKRKKKRNIHNPRLLHSCSVGISEPGSIKALLEALSLRRDYFMVMKTKRDKKRSCESSGVFRCDTNIQEGNPGITQPDV